MSKKQSKPKSKTAKPKLTKALVLFGLDENSQPRAARFMENDEELVNRAAQALGLTVGIATQAKSFKVVNELPLGRLHATGKAVVPNIARDLYDRLIALVGGEVSSISTNFAKSWEELAPGHLVVAQESIADGWWAAVVVKRDGETFTLKWRDDPGTPAFDLPITAVALLSSEPR